MPPYLPVFSISRSQSIRLGRGPGNVTVSELNSGDIPINPQTGALIGPFYADLGNANTRRDYQHHQTLGALIDVGSSSNTVYTDLFGSGLVVTAGTGFALNIAAGFITSRYSGAQIAVPAQVVTPAVPPLFGGRTDLVTVNAAGIVSIVAGTADLIGPTYQVTSVATSGVPTGGTFKLGVTYNGFFFQTAAIAYNAAASAVATAVLAATGGPNNIALSAYAPAAALTGSGGPLGTAAAVLTASAGLEGSFTVGVLANALTGGTTPSATATVTTTGVGAVGAGPNGSSLILAPVYIPSTASTSANYTIGAGSMLTS